MRRREFVTLVAGAIITARSPSSAQETGRVYRVGVLWPFPRRSGAGNDDIPIALLDGLARYGFIEGQNLTVDYRAWASHVDLISEYAAELVKGRPDVIAAGGDAAIRAAQQATKTIPILATTDDIIGRGLVRSMARPEGNTTGVSILATELDGKRQEILTETVPGLRRIGILADANSTAVVQLQALQEAARARNIEASIHRIARGEEIPAAIETARASGANALNVLASPMLDTNRRMILERVAALRLPAIYQWPETAEEGGFAAYGPRFTQIIRELAARQLAQLLRGRSVADIPIEQPTKFEMVVNLKTARALGIEIPDTLLVRADRVIE
jgi:putative ABC transport system substrate-binding protein